MKGVPFGPQYKIGCLHSHVRLARRVYKKTFPGGKGKPFTMLAQRAGCRLGEGTVFRDVIWRSAGLEYPAGSMVEDAPWFRRSG